jgi:hypothetical protein
MDSDGLRIIEDDWKREPGAMSKMEFTSLTGQQIFLLVGFSLITALIAGGWFVRVSKELGFRPAFVQTVPLVMLFLLMAGFLSGPELLVSRFAPDWKPAGKSMGMLFLGLLLLSLAAFRARAKPDVGRIEMTLTKKSSAADSSFVRVMRNVLLVLATVSLLLGIVIFFRDGLLEALRPFASAVFCAALATAGFNRPCPTAIAEDGVCLGHRLIPWHTIRQVVPGKDYVWLKVKRAEGWWGARYVRIPLARYQVGKVVGIICERSANVEINGGESPVEIREG